MDFQSTTERVVLVDPAGNRSEQVIEHRIDPLTGTVASLNGALGEKARAFLGAADLDLLRALEERTRPGCPFCDASAKGTRFPPDLVAGGQLRVGKALAIPNLFAKAALDAVVIVDPGAHVLFPSRIAPDALADAFRAARDLVRLAGTRDAARVHHVAGMNFLPPSGSSMPHPHLQVHARGVPYSGIARTAALAAAWRGRTGTSFFAELLDAERGGPRHVGRTGDVEWVAAWAPARQKEVWGVLPGVASLAELDDRGAEAFAAGVSKIVTSYEADGTHPFTFAFHASPEPGAAASWALHLKICARPAFRAQYVNFDTWFAPLFVGDDVHTEAPETYAARLRARW
jgi:UDPglucose--hexose-1-phosphate uridylyltransferase